MSYVNGPVERKTGCCRKEMTGGRKFLEGEVKQEDSHNHFGLFYSHMKEEENMNTDKTGGGRMIVAPSNLCFLSGVCSKVMNWNQ